jgi:hypothetical protein
VRYAGTPGEEELWIAIPGPPPTGGQSGNPWAVALLPLAMTLGEDLEIELPVCSTLRQNLGRLQALWRSWYPRLHDVRLRAPLQPVRPDDVAGPTGLFYSGGVDSAQPSAVPAPRGSGPDLLLVWGGCRPVEA